MRRVPASRARSSHPISELLHRLSWMIAKHLRGNLLGRLVSHVQDLDAFGRQRNAGLAEQPAHGARMTGGDAETAVRRTRTQRCKARHRGGLPSRRSRKRSRTRCRSHTAAAIPHPSHPKARLERRRSGNREAWAREVRVNGPCLRRMQPDDLSQRAKQSVRS